MLTSKEMKINALIARKKATILDEIELGNKIVEYANNGEMMICFVKNAIEEYPTISAAFIKELRNNGYKVDLWYKDGWDNLHRYYKGALKVSWYK